MKAYTEPVAVPAMPPEEEMWTAFQARDSSYVGLFYVGVKTTGIFCRPTCPARKPLRENMEFIASAREALLLGYRPCKRCEPLEVPGQNPVWIQDILRRIQEDPEARLDDAALRSLGHDPARVRRWFKKAYGLTFQGYQRSLRIGKAFGALRQGDKVTDAAFSSGFESLSGFSDAFKKVTGWSPSDSRVKTMIYIKRLPTPVGPMLAGATETGICLLDFTDRRMLATLLQRLQRRLKAVFVPGDSPYFEQLEQELKEYFAGKRSAFQTPLHPVGTDFQCRVWDLLRAIPHGRTRSYQEQATLLGNPDAVRAVAKANGDNCIAILIPCHRVIGKDGHLTGYGGGLQRKQYLLDLEKQES